MQTNRKKVLVLGAAGMAGHMVVDYFRTNDKYEVVGVARRAAHSVDCQLDFANLDNVGRFMENQKPDFVINCAGKLVADAEKNLDEALLINGCLPHFLAMQGARLGFKLVHISTDCVFSGMRGGYNESALKDGDSAYALTKATGEVINRKDLTIRTSIIGPELRGGKKGLLNWFLSMTGNVQGYTEAYWNGVTTLELAKAMEAMIQQNITGLYHLCMSKKISKFDLLSQIAKVWDRPCNILPDSSIVTDKSLICTRVDLDYARTTYPQMLEELRFWVEENNASYNC